MSAGSDQALSTEMTAEEVRALLGLEANATCGFVRETWRSALSVAPGGLPAPFADGRPLGSALYFLVTPAAHVKLHRIRNDQLYHYYLGDPLEVLLLRENSAAERVVVGPDLRAGQRVQLLIPVQPSIPPASPARAAGSSAPARNGRGWFRPTSNSRRRGGAGGALSSSRRRLRSFPQPDAG